jgi:hypothetical protein
MARNTKSRTPAAPAPAARRFVFERRQCACAQENDQPAEVLRGGASGRSQGHLDQPRARPWSRPSWFSSCRRSWRSSSGVWTASSAGSSTSCSGWEGKRSCLRNGISFTPIPISKRRSPTRSAPKRRLRGWMTSSKKSWCRPKRWSRCAAAARSTQSANISPAMSW